MIVTESPHERMVFDVQSETHPNRRYRVDLLANSGASMCLCKDWETRRGSNLKKGMPIGTRDTCCKHVLAARNYFLNTLLQAMAEKEKS